MQIFVIEGYVDPNDELIWEGPFGDHTGYYSLPDWYPKFHVTAITHKKNAIYPATIVGIPPQEDAWLGKATERIFLAPMKMTMVPEIMDMDMPVEGVFHNLVIAKIKKDYAGQAQKVMNAMWGAGQMMFNKILVIADEGVSIQNYKELAQYAFKNLNPSTDIFISTGPMDVLDHSCSKMGFGGKLCIDGTKKVDEEIVDENIFEGKTNITEEKLKSIFDEIELVNCSLLKLDIPCIIISFKKNKKNHFKELFNLIVNLKEIVGIKMILFVDDLVDVNDLTVALWRFCNNIDPRRDIEIISMNSVLQPEKMFSCIGLDGTTKSEKFDGFKRDWPNIIVADDATIKSVDEKWSSLNIGKFIASPSLKFKDQMMGDNAIAKTD